MLRETSDKLCLEYGLSVIKNPKKYTKKVNQYILKSFMNEIKRDIDATVLECARYVEFNAVMHNKGYSFGEINDESVIYHPYCEEPIYIKSLGNQYHREQIKERLTTKVIPFQNMEQNKYYYQCKDYYRQYRQKKLPQLAGMYVAHLVYLNILPQVKQKLSKEARRELKKLDQYTNDIELLAKNKIEDITQLDSYQENKQDELDYLIKQRQQCYYYRRNSKDEDEKEMWSTKAKEFTPQIKSLRFEIKSCKRIRERSIQKDIEKNMKNGKITKTGLPTSNVLYYELENNSWCCVRPSGTEPKIKLYMGVKADSMESAEKDLEELKDAMVRLVK